MQRGLQAGETFAVAWARAMAALERAVASEPKVAAADWRFAMRNTRPAWEAFYTGRARTPEQERALASRDSLAALAQRPLQLAA